MRDYRGYHRRALLVCLRLGRQNDLCVSGSFGGGCQLRALGIYSGRKVAEIGREASPSGLLVLLSAFFDNVQTVA